MTARPQKAVPGRRKPIVLYPTSGVFLDKKDELDMLIRTFGMTPEEALHHQKLQAQDELYVTQNARARCQYQVVVRRGAAVPQQMAMNTAVLLIMVRRIDGENEPFFWSDMQGIKNALCGEHVEALELYPRKERGIHCAQNFRYMWAFPDGEEIPVGWTGSK